MFLNAYFKLIMDYFASIMPNNIPIETAINLLSSVTFEDIQQEKYDLFGMNEASNVYIKIAKQSYIFDGTLFFLLINLNENQISMYKCRYDGHEISINDYGMMIEYISLEDFLATAYYVGSTIDDRYVSKEYVLYKNEHGIIYMHSDGSIRINVSKGYTYEIVENQEDLFPKERIDALYQDKNALIAKIKEQCEKS